eukprot:1605805-Pyramimonas_sp.AAC.1
MSEACPENPSTNLADRTGAPPHRQPCRGSLERTEYWNAETIPEATCTAAWPGERSGAWKRRAP